MSKQMSRFAMVRGGGQQAEGGDASPGQGMPDFDDPKIARAMGEIEREAEGLDENNPRHMAQILRKMKGILPPSAMPKEFDQAVKRLEAGEDPDKIEEEMGPLFDEMMGGKPGAGSAESFSRDPGLYDF